MIITTYNTIFIIINNTINDSVTLIKQRARNRKHYFKFTHAHTNIMKHEHVFTQPDHSPSPEGSRTIGKLFPQDRNIKLGWKALCTLLCTIALILECINVTLNERCITKIIRQLFHY